jgi:lipoic acid synthetase
MTTSSSPKPLHKPAWIRVKLPHGGALKKTQQLLREHHHCTVCEEAACPNLGECFHRGTATFLIMGDTCTRHCRFCNVMHGAPKPLDPDEPKNLAQTVLEMKLKYVVITSVDRDDLDDGGAKHYADCIRAIRALNPAVKIEILTPDFRGCMNSALHALSENPPDVFNHNVETVPRLYHAICPSANYELSLALLQQHKKRFPHILTKSGIMVGLGEAWDEIIAVLKDLRAHEVDMLTAGQYLQPSKQNVPVERYMPPEEFAELARIAKQLGFKHAACGPFVRSSYHAEEQAAGQEVK